MLSNTKEVTERELILDPFKCRRAHMACLQRHCLVSLHRSLPYPSKDCSCARVHMQAVVEEFSPATASMLGLPWGFHERCRAGLEADYLQPMYLHARSVARESAAAGLAGQDGGTCQACLALMCAILSWDFRCASHPPAHVS